MRTILWVVVAVAVTIFAFMNADPVEVTLIPGDSGVRADTSLAVVILTSFLLGFLPTWLMMSANRWRMNRRIENQKQTIDQLRGTTATGVTPAVDPATGHSVDPVTGRPIDPVTGRPTV